MVSEKARRRQVAAAKQHHDHSDGPKKRPKSGSHETSIPPWLLPVVITILGALFVLLSAAHFMKLIDFSSIYAVQNADNQSAKNNDTSTNSNHGTSVAEIMNDADSKIKIHLDEAEDLLSKGKVDGSINKYEEILKLAPSSPLAHYGMGLAILKKADNERSNSILERSIQYLAMVIDIAESPEKLMKDAADLAAEKLVFRGWPNKAAKLRAMMVQKFPNDLQLLNKQGVSHLLANNINDARTVFKQVLERDPVNGYALCHYGFILKTTGSDIKGAIRYLNDGINSKHPGTNDGRFYYHLGDALNRDGQKDKATEIHRKGAENGHFKSTHQRSLYNIDRLMSRPLWTPEETGYEQSFKMLEDNWQTIRDEGIAMMDPKTGAFVPEDENLREKGDWQQLTLWQQGRKSAKNCEKVPKTCALIDRFPAARGCTRGQVKFSVMQPGVHIWGHTGPTNCRIRAHLGLVVPVGPVLRVVDTNRTWTEGKFLIFDDSFEHEVWHEGESFRLVLIVDVWHPEVTDYEKSTLPPI